MPEYAIEGITVNFPYNAYPCQINYMQRVIACLNQGWNGILESPTGTGKTLCLLCACLAWQQDQKRQRQNEASSQLRAYVLSGQVTSLNDEMLTQCVVYPRVLYTSRTHMQLSQVVRELNKTVYKTVKTCLMGSRDQLCLHEDVRKEPNNTIKNHMCRAKVRTRTCQFYNGFDGYQNTTGKLPGMENKQQDATASALDMEDFISFGRRNKICPFFASRMEPEKADLILMPYNYVVDARARKANKVDLNNAILIFDEAHNLGKVCEESASHTFTSKDITGSVRESKEALNMLLVEEEALRRQMDETKLAFGAVPKEELLQVKFEPKELADLIKFLENFEKEIDKIDLQSGSSEVSVGGLPGLTQPGSFMLDLLRNAEIFPFMRETLDSLIDKVTSYLTQKAANRAWQSNGAHLQKFVSLLNTVFTMDDGEEDAAARVDFYKANCRHFKVYASRIEETKRASSTMNNFLKSTNRRQCVQLNYWCFNGGLAMQSIAQTGTYSILVTSGTLAPLSHFQTEMKIPFHLSLENEHIINADQAWFGVVCQGPDGCPLDASYANRHNEAYVSSLGNTLVNIFRIVPEGCLVFFASYAQMTTCIEKWRASGTWSRMTKFKALYVEPKSKDEFYQTIGEYNNVVKTRPAAFLAVCRGKVSEGIDFSDSSARAVVIMGIPYPPMYDPRVVLKKEFLDNQQKACSQTSSKSGDAWLDGDTWYRTEAVRAVNQSIGRVIRHKDDYGAIILADQRFSSWNKNQFPSWIVSNKSVYPKFGEFSKSLAQFFKDKGLKVEKFTAVRPKETSGFEKNTTQRKRDIDGLVKVENSVDRLQPKQEPIFSDIASHYANGALEKHTEASNCQQTYGTIWESLQNTNNPLVKDGDPFDGEEYKPNAVRLAEVLAVPNQRPKIKIKKEVKDDGRNGRDQSAEQTEHGESTKKGNSADKLRKAMEYKNKLKEQLNPDHYKQFCKLMIQYKGDRQLNPLLEFFGGLVYRECSEIIKGFTQCVHAEQRVAYSEFLNQLETMSSTSYC